MVSRVTGVVKLFPNAFCVVERLPCVCKARSGNLNLDIASLTRQKSLRQVNWNAPAGEHTWNNRFLDAERQSHKHDELFVVKHLCVWTQYQRVIAEDVAEGVAGSSRTGEL